MSSSSDNHGWTGAEPFLVGIAPNFWAHVPMTISAVNDLKLVHGIHCWSSVEGNHHVPVSKCVLVGCIVNATIRSSDESTMYVLDDGTGLMDCLVWANNNESDIFHLPLLAFDDNEEDTRNKIGLGDFVRVFGKIQCVTIQGEHLTGQEPFVVREIQASLVERILDVPNEEGRHWIACAKREAAMARDPTKFNALGYLKLLGPDITSQVRARRHLPATDDVFGEWRIFGTYCTCDLEYKTELLYCHCLAKVEPLDPQFVFRDAVLNHLLGVQSTMNAKKLMFPYKGIKINPKLRAIASTVLTSSSNSNSNNNNDVFVDRILLNTFRALRHDGILHLADMDTDQYLLISRKWVLEPYVRRELEISRNEGGSSTNFINFENASFISNVHRNRLLYIKRIVKEEANAMKTKQALNK